MDGHVDHNMHVVGPQFLLGESLGPIYTIDWRCSPFPNNMAYVRPVDLLCYHVYKWFKRDVITKIVLLKMSHK